MQKTSFNILRAAHAGLLVTNLEKALEFYTEVLGLELSADGLLANTAHLRTLAVKDACVLSLEEAEMPGVSHIAFRVGSDADLEALELKAVISNRAHYWMTISPYHGRALRIADPNGMPIVFFHEMERDEMLLQQYDKHHGARPMWLDHFNVFVPDVALSERWFCENLGFRTSERLLTSEDNVFAIWLHRKSNVHDIALTNGRGPRVHHIAFWVRDERSILDACDILAACGMHGQIERGPARHGISNAFFVYLRDPDGNRIELFTGDYPIFDPDNPVITWHTDDPQYATFWGTPAPKSWFEEGMLVKGFDGCFITPRKPSIETRPPTSD
ncbi:3,4-dihydroxyphenylacetate 2,3-dioxygenase [Candidatus Kaiserbacteria bacterium RIFCSPHIGHO2_01_FULL_50_13]|uniref:3,4-dihydroxyphenylacetate 2,3-dioxygenase n=1 Tax=Candidatus Kaiserbacteria bacterium RIFCSPLOWO2_01_FULL_50_24 TaxID=1798507 RepID=A0A1F6EMY2_9BACT|nr:MAG: 3,4-dihydroxyphenylacetate 2,3-dioxygenase [Candidatus Kaiserbacteria bacterium RIFCSPHIGHO2_01_FULL_50_13]OGG75008.1 MAG: 3,4-dihydroxyphenylacetate 2,3-dioxygenase [Candidatus Kaiserbacteria bacterium RIFCSPLOWO2_01_FULL_50_24]OGG82062.1 MAG: 3,4-dihydroxyphenylacetate 2,3-dioxygenase [Candidatus Kaiserbacteria bacterium RIFCSPLOWO2_02_FULL_51_13]